MSYFMKKPKLNTEILYSEDFDTIISDPQLRLEFVYHFAQQLGLSDQQVAIYCGSTVRSWKDWINNRRPMPQNIAELFALKIKLLCSHDHSQEGGLCAIFSKKDEIGYQMPISSFSGTGFLSCDIDPHDSSYAYLSSMAVNFENIPYKHVVKFHRPSNKHIEKWIENLQ